MSFDAAPAVTVPATQSMPKSIATIRKTEASLVVVFLVVVIKISLNMVVLSVFETAPFTKNHEGVP